MKIRYYSSIFCMSAIMATASLSFAQSHGDNSGGDMSSAADPSAKTAAMPAPDGVTMYKDTVYVIKDGAATKVTEKTTVSDGIIVDKMSIIKDGKVYKLEEGKMLTLDGTVVDAPKGLMDAPSGADKHGGVATP